MQRSFEIRRVTSDDYESLKNLWSECFDDSFSVIDNFFNKTVTAENVIAAFDGNLAVGALYIVDGSLLVQGCSYDALYIYAVCTHPQYRKLGVMTACFEQLEKVAKKRSVSYVFLVPADEPLFTMYEKLGFKTGFRYSEETVCKNESLTDNTELLTLEFSQYMAFKGSVANDFSVAVLGEKGFDSFLCPVGNDIACLYDGKGYVVFEKEKGKITVHECAGELDALFNKIFVMCNACSITVRKPTRAGGVPFGMYRAFGNVPELDSAFFGIPYGG